MDNEINFLSLIMRDLEKDGVAYEKALIYKSKIQSLMHHNFDNGVDYGKRSIGCTCKLRKSTLKATPKKDIDNGTASEEEQWTNYRANEINRGN